MRVVYIVCGSNHHLISGLAFASRAGLVNKDSSLVFLTESFMANSYRPDNHILAFIRNKTLNVDLRCFNGLEDIKSTLPESIKDIIFITPRKFSLRIYLYLQMNKGKHGKVLWFESEEGIGSHRSHLTRLASELQAKKFGSAIKFIVNICPEWLLRSRAIRYIGKDNKNNQVVEDRDAYRQFAYRALSEYKECFNVYSPHRLKPMLLFVSQPAVEAGWLCTGEMTQLITELKVYANYLGLDFKIKPHPAESLYHYPNSTLYEHETAPLEAALCFDGRIKVVGSICSTALYTTQILSMIESVMITTPNLEKKLVRMPSVIMLSKNVDRKIMLCKSENIQQRH